MGNLDENLLNRVISVKNEKPRGKNRNLLSFSFDCVELGKFVWFTEYAVSLYCQQLGLRTGDVKQHKVVEEQLHLAATIWTAQMLKEPLQRAVLDTRYRSRGVS